MFLIHIKAARHYHEAFRLFSSTFKTFRPHNTQTDERALIGLKWNISDPEIK